MTKQPIFFLSCRACSIRSDGVSPKGSFFCNSFQMQKLHNFKEVQLDILEVDISIETGNFIKCRHPVPEL